MAGNHDCECNPVCSPPCHPWWRLIDMDLPKSMAAAFPIYVLFVSWGNSELLGVFQCTSRLQKEERISVAKMVLVYYQWWNEVYQDIKRKACTPSRANDFVFHWLRNRTHQELGLHFLSSIAFSFIQQADLCGTSILILSFHLPHLSALYTF